MAQSNGSPNGLPVGDGAGVPCQPVSSRLGAVEAPYGAAVMDRNGRPYGPPILWPQRWLFAGLKKKKERQQPMRAACRLDGAPVSSGWSIRNGGGTRAKVTVVAAQGLGNFGLGLKDFRVGF